jgi:hypothetical protein
MWILIYNSSFKLLQEIYDKDIWNIVFTNIKCEVSFYYSETPEDGLMWLKYTGVLTTFNQIKEINYMSRNQLVPQTHVRRYNTHKSYSF